jgi:hypothetical protein
VFAGRVREHRFDRRFANGAATPLGEDQRAGDVPIACDRHRGYRQRVDGIADQRDRPVLTSPIGDIPRYRPEAVAETFARPRDDADRCSAGAERCEKLAIDAGSAFVRHVAKQIDDANHQDESKGSGRGGLHLRARCIVRIVDSVIALKAAIPR